jgi:hypothetical protein
MVVVERSSTALVLTINILRCSISSPIEGVFAEEVSAEGVFAEEVSAEGVSAEGVSAEVTESPDKKTPI